ncbi:hypothetical protein VF14_33140 [Nostoc linckia z18]|jgi:hypothetical protein|uniref:CopG-like ribbon-helix-helix domain-containing protein n=2 Tax=Nostoc linckia TaxID=92942 RepID=A0A9Q5Z5I8_NOSLI|nr:hypothetical protein [Nostoc linckia]PHK42580.1 hypothetical protein VF12_02655 [Nostoc linckia z15]PHK47899.1 hypothetical protein VF13_02715 [Nostoc linckia z16]PHJ55605.1 hypothetical protein VF02_35825 [Nostoc linckia z1]PHJ57804.1 hypothetical protein VF03_36165 [Nostoc linckia z2]PHJ69629.1 hypothetical protein VF05_13000 [Nostoc linckia z3]
MSQKKRFLLRLDLELYEVLEKWSADELRSVNAQIEYLLTEAARKTGRWKEKKRQKDTKRLKMDTQIQNKSDDES